MLNLYKIYAQIIVLLGTIFVVALIVIFTNGNQVTEVIEITRNNIEEINYFNALSLEAKSVFVWDVNKQKVLFSINESAQLPLASLTKLMTAITANDILPKESVVTIDNTSLLTEGDSGLYENEKWKFKDLIQFTLMMSSNDGANAVANVAGLFKNNFPSREENNKKSFVQAMNAKAKEIGLNQTYFINPTGLDTNNDIGGGYGSARDIALLLEYAIINTPEVVEATRHNSLKFNSLNNIDHIATNTNSGVNAVPGLIASKTGYTNLAGGNLVIAYDAGINHPIIISVLGSTAEGRFRDVERLVDASLKSLK